MAIPTDVCKCEKPIEVQAVDKSIHCGYCKKMIVGTAPVEKKILAWMISLDPSNGQVDVKGPIDNLGEFYKTVEIAKDIVKKWNELNNHYLEFHKTPQEPKKHGILDFAKKR